jgi:Fe-Mn family superoxide dismutase
MATTEAYQAKQFKLSGLQGISDQTLEMHFKLYEGYVKETNRLTEKISEFLKDGQVDQEEMPAYSELTRRMGFEYNGMVLHEYYFGNMTKGGSGDPGKQSAFYKRQRAASAAMIFGKPTLSASAKCAVSAGRSAFRIPNGGG